MNIFDNVLNCGEEIKQKILGRKINIDFEQVLVIFFDGSTRILEAIKLLHDNGFYEEGFSLTRLLLEAMIDLEYINLGKENRAQQYVEFDKLKSNEMLDKLNSLVPPPSPTKFTLNFQFKNKMRWSQVTFDKMLEEISSTQQLEPDYFSFVYKFLCSFAHPSVSGLGATTAFLKEDVSARQKVREDYKRILSILSCHFVLDIYSHVDKEFSLGNSAHIKQISEEISPVSKG